MTAPDGGRAVQTGGVEYGAGGVVLDRQGRVLLVRYRSGAWAFPKGHIEAGETPQQTAAREVREEGGVRASVLRPLPDTRYTNDRGVPRVIHWFVMSTGTTEQGGAEGGASEQGAAAEESGVQLEDTFSEGGFFEPQAALTLLSYPEDQQLLRLALT